MSLEIHRDGHNRHIETVKIFCGQLNVQCTTWIIMVIKVIMCVVNYESLPISGQSMSILLILSNCILAVEFTKV